MSKPTDLQRDWPADPDNDDLARLAAELQGAPALPAESLARIKHKIDAELERGQRWQRRRRLAFGWSIAAAILIALCGYALLRPSPEHTLQLVKQKEAPAPRLIEDRVTIAIGEPDAGPNADKPLVRLDDYRSLFTD